MNLTLLIDLDNTLLKNDMADFLPLYFQALSSQFPRWQKDEFIARLLAATQVMVKKDIPLQTLEQAFDDAFYPALGVEKSAIEADLQRFYSNEFGALNSVTMARPESIDLVQRAGAAGWDMVVATNPVFPQSAIRHRLRWAGFPQGTPFKFATSFEDFHFAKPHPAYYAEILARLGWPAQPAVMLGDRLEDDILPAAALGIHGYLVTDHPVPLPENLPVQVHQGKLDEAYQWLASLPAQSLVQPGQLSSIQSVSAILKAAPAAIESMCRGLTLDQWTFRPGENEWALVEILYHLRDADLEVNLPRIQKIVRNEVPFLPGVETDPWAKERDYIHQSPMEALNGFIRVRSEICQILNSLSQDQWQSAARHAIFGPTTLFELTGFMATHDIAHIRQVFQNLELSTRH